MTGTRTPIISLGPVNLALAITFIVALGIYERYRAWKVRQ